MVRWIIGILFFFLFLLLVLLWWGRQQSITDSATIRKADEQTTVPLVTQRSGSESIPLVTVIAEGLEIPWAIAFLPARDARHSVAGGPTGGMLVTERPGRVRLIDAEGKLQQEPVATISDVKHIGEGGLLGIALHPQFETNQFVYVYYTYAANENNTRNRVVRYLFENNTLRNPHVIVDAIPGASNHNGGRIKFGPDGYLYITTGDAQEPSLAQNTSSLAGKILRVTDAGKAAPKNPFDNLVYSYGHRNPQGLAWDASGQLWETEHGRSGSQSGLDEVNRITAGGNYGWPEIQGNETRTGIVTPVRNSGATTTWAPAGAAFVGNRLFFGGLRGSTLYEAVIREGTVSSFTEHFAGEFGRIREVIFGPDNLLYITTSNRDGRGQVHSGDDKIIRVNLEKM